MYSRITDSNDKLYPTRIPSKARSDQSVELAVYVLNISDGIIGKLKLEGKVYIGGRAITSLAFGGETYENTYPGMFCLFEDEFTMPRHDIGIQLIAYHWKLRPMAEGDVQQYGEWAADSVREYEIAVVLPPPPPPELTNITMTFSITPPTTTRRIYVRP